MSRRSWILEPESKSNEGARTKIDSPGEYKLASSLAPAWCGPHLAMLRPGPCGSGFGASTPQPFSSSILAISPLWARPLQPLSLHDPSRKHDLYCARAKVASLPLAFFLRIQSNRIQFVFFILQSGIFTVPIATYRAEIRRNKEIISKTLRKYKK